MQNPCGKDENIMDDKNPDKQSKRVRLYYIAAILLILIINTVISPMFFQPKVHEVSYTNFLNMVDEGKATKVEITKDRIALCAIRMERNRFM